MLNVKNLSKSFKNNKVLSGIGFAVKEGESFVIMGGSGSGKSVLIKSIIGLIEPDFGASIVIDGNNLCDLSSHERLAYSKNFGVLFQGGALFDSIEVWQNVAFFMIHNHGMSKAEAYDLARQKIKLVGLDQSVLDKYPAELSGGMQKRVAIARAICRDPKIIFFDEPTAGLDPIMSGVISNVIRECSQELNAATITITHDMHCASAIADKAALLFNGKFIWQGDGKEISATSDPYMHQFVNGLVKGPFTV